MIDNLQRIIGDFKYVTSLKPRIIKKDFKRKGLQQNSCLKTWQTTIEQKVKWDQLSDRPKFFSKVCTTGDKHYLSCCTIFTENKILLRYLLFTCSSHHEKSLKITYWYQMWPHLRTKLSALNSKFCLVTCMLRKKYVFGKQLHHRILLATPCICYFNIKEPLGTCRMSSKTKKPKTILLNSD